MAVKITNIEYCLPKKILSNSNLKEEFNDFNINKIEKIVGIKERHIVRKDETALDLALKVAKKILKNYNKDKIDFLILCTQSPEYYLPSGACILQDRLRLKTDIGAFDYNLGCSGFIYGLAIAKGLIGSNIASSILLITSDIISKYINSKDKSNRTIFGDAAAAIIVEKSETEQIGEFVLGTDGSGYKNIIVPNGGLRNRYDPNAIEVDDGSGSIRTDNNLYMNGSEIFNFTIKTVPKVVSETLEKNNVTLEGLDYVIFHQANKYVIEYLRKKIGIPEDKFYINLLHTGNTSSSTIPLGIKDSINKNVIKKGSKILIASFGVGYSWGGTVITI
jgi:3-oxoacyl-[acyl-carrier-protein] synthase-3